VSEVIADSQTCLASADDHGSEVLITQGRQLSSRSIDFPPTAVDEVVIVSHGLRRAPLRK
jgi:hypothetical protein